MENKSNALKIIVIFIVVIIVGIINYAFYAKHHVNYNYPKYYKGVFESYLPDGYEVSSEWFENSSDEYYDYYGNGDIKNNERNYGKYKYYYIEYDNGTEIALSSLAEKNYGADEAVSMAIKETMTENYKTLLRSEIKSTYAKYGTLITYVDFKCSDSDILKNKYEINLNEMDWKTFSNLPITITYKMIPNRDNSEETLTDLMDDLISLTKEKLNSNDIEVSYYFESSN